MILNKNKLLIALKYLSTPSFFTQRNYLSILYGKNVDEWATLLWKYMIIELGYDKDSSKIYRNDFDKLVLYYLNENETNNLFKYICNGINYFTYEKFLRFLLLINDSDLNKIINSFEKNKN
tara:strand:+ start:82 stop:444 length:363 start_codon:yes stop_codon:yes gene_type:complete